MTTYFKSLKGLVSFIALITFSTALLGQTITKPAEHFGFEPGADGMLYGYERMIDYFKLLEKQSDRIKTFEIGTTPMGRPLYMVCISSAQNIANIEALKEINRKLALDYNLSKGEVDKLKSEGKVFVLGTLSMHSSEVAPAQASPVIAYMLAKSQNPDTLEWLNNTVYMMVPSHNPDGMNMVVENYLQHKGTKYEGTSLPGVYHKYVGHNINRDFVMLTQPENKAISSLTSTHWFPQVMVEKHQMGSTGVRFFVPPNHDPIAQNIDETLWSWIGLFGANMLNDMTALGQQGIAQRHQFDNYWPGSTETCLWKNVISFLTESASVKTATPIYIEKNELKVRGKGLSEYKKGANLIAPWEGGWWRLSDLVAYELSSTFSMLKTASVNREALLQYRNDICKKEYAKGISQPPFYYVIPSEQNNRSEALNLLNLLIEHGVTVSQLGENVLVDNRLYSKGDFVVSLAQPFRAFIKEVMEKQVYPERHYTPGGEMIKPYDITTWSLPLLMGVNAVEVNTRSVDLEKNISSIGEIDRYTISNQSVNNLVLKAGNNDSYLAAFAVLGKGGKVFRITEDLVIENIAVEAGSFVIPQQSQKFLDGVTLIEKPIAVESLGSDKLVEVKMPNIGLVESWFSDMDAGWTRFIFDNYRIPYTVLRPADLADAKKLKGIQLIVFPNHSAELLSTGKRKRGNDYYPMNMPPEFTKGMGKQGKQNLLKFIHDGGKVVAWGQSTELFLGVHELELSKDSKEEFTLPVSEVSAALTRDGLEAIGCHVMVNSIKNHPLTYGMPESFPIYFTGSPIFETSVPYFDTDRRVLISYPVGDPRISGYIKNGKLLEDKAALVWIRKNQGQLLLFGFNPQFRGQTSGTFKLLFNALLE
ncbi:MAG: M14 family zinc carboxypeptidase [Tenuifilaceae bacterium]|jgi:hypothetical protein|nr:M14 family zinc carboxypeptidase [Tenuifilaceae bacterium]